MTFRPVLTVLLFIFLVPVSVKAQTLVGPGGLTQSVIDAAAVGGILQLTGDQTLTTTLTISKNLTIRGQGTNPDGTPAIVIKQTGDGRHFTCATADITINFENVALIGPNATYAGGVVTSNDAVASGGGIANTQKTTTVNVSNCMIAGCRATTAEATTTVTGGGISVAGPLTVSSSSILYNTTNDGNGGGIYAGEISALSGNNTVSYNKAGWTGTDYSETAYTGGGIHLSSLLTTLTDTLICKGNVASGDGGGIYKVASTIIPYPVTITVTGLRLLQVDGNESKTGGGGGIYTTSDLNLNDLQKGSSISGNKAATAGGGIYAYRGLVLNNTVVSDNMAAGTSTSSTGNAPIITGGGGGICAADVARIVTLNNCTISNNRTESLGGGFYSVSNQSLQSMAPTLNSCTVTNNSSAKSGGGIYAKGNLVLKGKNNISHNTAGLTGTTYSSSAHGGGISANEFALNVSDTLICIGNVAGGFGGGIYKSYTTTNGAFIVTNLKLLVIDSCESKSAGGGIYTITSLEFNKLPKGSSITRNRAATTGGGIQTAGNIPEFGHLVRLKLCNLTISNNTAGNSGGGVFASGPLTFNGENTISENKAGWTGAAYSTTAYTGGGIHINAALTTLTDTLICERNGASGNGGGIYKAAGSFTTTNLKLLHADNNESRAAGGGIYTSVALDLSNLQEGSISGNTAKTTGGGIHTTEVLTLNNVSINNNKATTNGGGIYAGVALTLGGNNTISGNKAGWNGTIFTGNYSGGGIFAANALTLSGSLTCENDTASQHGGGIYKQSNATTLDASRLTYLKLNRNAAGKGVATGAGGGANFNGSATVGADFSNATIITITENEAAATGGGIHSTAALTLSNSIVNINTAGTSGGGIYAANSLTLSKNNTISGNKAGWNGTGYSTIAYYGGGMFTSNNLILSDTLICNNNAASGNGGGIYKSSASAAFDVTGLNVLQLNNNAAGKGVAGASGGGAYFNGSAMVGADFSNATSIEIIGNIASGTGGGIHSAAALTLSNSIVNINTAGTSGGGIYAANSLTLSKNNTISGNKAGWDGTGYSTTAYYGGGIYATSNFTLSDTLTCNDNIASSSGGGIYKNSTTATLNATGLKFLQLKGNAAGKGVAGAGGGGAYFNGSAMVSADFSNATSIEIVGNIASGSGGGIYATSTLALANATISNNTAGTNGGGIYATGALSLSGNDTISYNKAGYDATTDAWKTTPTPGGGIYAGNNLILKDTLVCNGNTATGAGGGIWKSTTGTTTFETDELVLLEVTDNTAGHNVTAAQFGGGIYAGVVLYLSNLKQGLVSNNKASSSGGGIYAANKLSLINTTLSNNTAGTNGGAYYGGGIYAAGDLQSNANTFAGNQAVNGGAIYLNNTATVINSTFSANTATTYGGAVYANASAHNISLSTFNGNKPSAIYFYGSANQTLRGNILYGNGTPEASIKPAIADYNIIRGLNWGGTNKNVAAEKADSIFAVADNATDLATLADNGGPTETLDIKQNGLAYNLIPNDIAASWTNITTDQHGLSRSSGCKTDVGAVELQVGDQEDPDATILGITEACTGDEVEFSAQATGMQSYLWTVTPNGTKKGNGKNDQESFTWTTTGIKTVKLAVIDSENCEATATTDIEIKQRSETGPMYRVPNLQ